VQEQACKALVWIARGNDDNQVAMAKAGGIHVVVTALQQHLTHVGVQEEACKVLNQLATNADNRAAMAKAGCIDVLVVALQQLPTQKDVQKEACGALNQLAANADNQVTMAKQ
jgi:vacuolar protein 8